MQFFNNVIIILHNNVTWRSWVRVGLC